MFGGGRWRTRVSLSALSNLALLCHLYWAFVRADTVRGDRRLLSAEWECSRERMLQGDDAGDDWDGVSSRKSADSTGNYL